MKPRALFVPEMMEDAKRRALMSAMERLLEDDAIETVWPAAFGAKKTGSPIPLEEVEVVVLPLDRIGAPAGASGAGVYIAYYSHAPKTEPRRVASPPLVVKIGDATKLQQEKDGADAWPPLSPHEAERFARPFHLDKEDAEWAVLIAPFHSEFKVREEGTRNDISVNDLWRLLEDKNELLEVSHDHWVKIERCIGQALDAVFPPHRSMLAKPKRENQQYSSAYEWYLRSTTGTGRLRHIPKSIFGSEPKIDAFGQTWDSPVLLVEELMSGREFSGHFGAIHGDLHPKNIVLNHENAARIIDFGWARREAHIVQDYILLDLNLRGITLPSQMSETDILALAGFLFPAQDVDVLPDSVRPRARIIKDVIWRRAETRAVLKWQEEYLIPLLLVGYGLLVYLDSARNQPALVATVLAATRVVRESVGVAA